MIHKYRMHRNNIVLDVESGIVNVVDDLTFEILGMLSPPLEKKCPEFLLKSLWHVGIDDILSRYSEIFQLYTYGKIFSSKKDYSAVVSNFKNSPIKALCLNVSHDCNLRCRYCFAATGNFGGKRMLMSYDVAKRAIDFLVEKSGTRKNLEIDFFGGEPLMNFKVIKEVVAYARDIEKDYNKNFRFTITTNGLLLNDDIIDFINNEMYNVVLSIDGRKQVNDFMRSTSVGLGSHDIILPNFMKLIKKRKNKNYYVRGTFTKYNLDFFEDVKYLYDCGFNQISIEPVVCDSTNEYSLTRNDISKIFEQYEKLANWIIEKKESGCLINFFHFMVDLNSGPCVLKRLKGCGCGNEYLAISPDGLMYPCHQFVGNSKFQMGDLNKKNFNLNMKEKFSNFNLVNKIECDNCWAKFFCSGGCNANNFKFNNNFFKPHKFSCDLEKKRLECAIAIESATTDF